MAEMTTGALGVRLSLMQELAERARDLELEGCAVRIGIDGARMWLSVDFAACAPVDPILRELRDFEKSAPAFAPRGSAAADAAPEPEPVADLQPEPVAEPEPAPERKAEPAAAEEVDPDAPGALAAHLARVIGTGGWTRAQDCELIRLACLGWSLKEVEDLDLTGTGASVSARHAVLAAKRRWSIYEIAAALGVEIGEAAA